MHDCNFNWNKLTSQENDGCAAMPGQIADAQKIVNDKYPSSPSLYKHMCMCCTWTMSVEMRYTAGITKEIIFFFM